MKKRIISMIMSLVMVLTMLPINIWAEGQEFEGNTMPQTDEDISSVNNSSTFAAGEIISDDNLNGTKDSAGEETGTDDMQCLFEYLSTNEMNSMLVPEDEPDEQKQADNEAYFKAVADVNEDGTINILDYQALYELVKSVG